MDQFVSLPPPKAVSRQAEPSVSTKNRPLIAVGSMTEAPGIRSLDTDHECYHIGNTMHVVTRKRLREFVAKHADAAIPLAAWFKIVSRRRYANGHEVRADFASVDFLGGSRTVFDIGGNKYRLVVDMRYDLGRIYVRHVLTHREYDRRTNAGTL